MCPQVPILQQLNPSIAGHSSRGCKCEGSSSSIEQPLKCLNLFVAIGLRIIYSLRIIWWMSRGVVAPSLPAHFLDQLPHVGGAVQGRLAGQDAGLDPPGDRVGPDAV